MSREPSETVEYFPFFVKEGKTLFILDQQFPNNEGVGFFTKLMIQLAITPGHILDLEDESTRLFVIARLGVRDENRFSGLMQVLMRTGKIDSELWDKRKVIFCERFLESLKPIYDKRHRKLLTKSEAHQKYLKARQSGTEKNEGVEYKPSKPIKRVIPEHKAADMPQSKVKESKAKQSKGIARNELVDNSIESFLESTPFRLSVAVNKKIRDRMQTKRIKNPVAFLEYCLSETKDRAQVGKESGFFVRAVLEWDDMIARYGQYKPGTPPAERRLTCPCCAGTFQDTNTGSSCPQCGLELADWGDEFEIEAHREVYNRKKGESYGA
jgi:hypothetical protein